MDSNRKMIGAGVIALLLITAAYTAGKKSTGNPTAAANPMMTQNPQAPAPPAGNAAPQTNPSAMPPLPYGGNPGADMSAPSPNADMNPGGQMQSGAPMNQQIAAQPEMGGGNQYRDPQGQFTIAVPQGWQSTPQNGGVVITRGSSMVVISPFDGAESGEQIVSTLSRQYASQWNNLQVSDQGQFSIGGAPAAYMMMSGRSPRGVQSLLRIAGTVRGNQGFAIIISSPLSDFNSASPQLQSIESSLAFGGN